MFNDDRPATPGEAYDEWVQNAGSDHPDQEWILTDWDSWEHNPHYTGPPGPHPEDQHYDGEDCQQWGHGEPSDEELEELTKPTNPFDDVPF